MSSALVHRSLFNFNSLAALVFVLATKGLLICCPSSLPIPKALIAVVLLLAAAAHGEIPATPLLLGLWPRGLPMTEALVTIERKMHGTAELWMAHTTPCLFVLGPRCSPR